MHQSGHLRRRHSRFPHAAAEPVLLVLAAGVIAQATSVSLRAAIHCLRTRPLPLTQTAAVTTMAAVITALAVHTAG